MYSPVLRQIGLPGELHFIGAGELPALRLYTATEFAYCWMSSEMLEDSIIGLDLKSTPTFRNLSRMKDSASQRIMGLLADELEAGAPSGRLYAESLAQALAIRFLCVGNQNGHRVSSRASELPARIFRRVREKMDAGLHADLSLLEIAAESGYSRTHFLRMFRASTGMTPHQYLMTLRIDRAKELLANPNSNLIDVATICGFSSQSHMTTVFRRLVGLTPTDYRRDVLPNRRGSRS